MMKKRFLLGLLMMAGVMAFIVTGSSRELTQAADANDQILVWNAPAVAPGQQAAEEVGDLVYIDGTGQTTVLTEVLAQSSRVEACGPNAISPDGRHLALYMGTSGGVVSSLYLSTDGAEPVLVSDAFQPVACEGGNGILNFSEDSSRMVFIAYERQFQVEFADGILHIISTDDYSELLASRNATAFDQNDDGVVFASFFTNDRQEADEVAVTWWDGNIDRELVAMLAEDGCKYLSANVRLAPDGMIWLALAERCGSGPNTVHAYRINPADRSMELMFSEEAGGAYAAFAQTNSIFFSGDGSMVFYTVPDGFTNATASLHAYSMADGTTTIVMRQQVVVAAVDPPPNAPLTISPDHNWVALVVTSPNGRENTLRLISLVDPTAAAIETPAGGQGDTVRYMAFTRDSSKLVYVAGGNDNSLLMVDLTSSAPSPLRVRRGNYSQWATLSPDGTEIAILEFQIQPDDVRGPDYLNLQIVNLDTSEVTTIFEGGEVVDGEVTNAQFAAPIHWRRP